MNHKAQTLFINLIVSVFLLFAFALAIFLYTNADQIRRDHDNRSCRGWHGHIINCAEERK